MRPFEILAQTTTSVTQQPATSQPVPTFLDILRQPMTGIMLAFLVFWIFMMRSKKGGERKRQDMLKALKKGDRIQTIGGMIGNVVEVRETEVLVKIDESSNTKVRFIRSAIHRVIGDEKGDSK